MVGAWILYGVSAAIGPDRTNRFVVRFGKWFQIGPDDMAKAEAWFDQPSHPQRTIRCGADSRVELTRADGERVGTIGTREQPAFGPRQQIVCDGYEDSPEKLRRSAELAADRGLPQHPYPYEEDQPFYWRTGPGFGDLNGDGLMDMITHDGHTRKLTLFVQYRDEHGALRLRKERPLNLTDGRLIDDSIVERASHWTESFRCVDWDGDGLLDIIYSCSGTEPEKGSIYLLRNCGTLTEPVFEPPVTLCCFGEPIKITAHGPHPAVADIDGDGRPDILACVEWSVYPFYSHAAMEMPRRPEYQLGPVRAL